MLKKKGGLGSLIPGSELLNEATVEMIDVESISANPFQPRVAFNPQEIAELSESIKIYGIIQPLTLRRTQSGYELIAGERRLQAAIKSGLNKVPAIVKDCKNDEDMLALALVENIQRSNLNPIELAISYERLQKNFGWKQQDIASKVGKSRSSVANTIRLLDLSDNILSSLASSEISEGHGKVLLSISDLDARDKLFLEILKSGLTVREAEARVSETNKERKAVKSKKQKTAIKDPNLEHIRHTIQAALALKVSFKSDSDEERGTIEIEYFSADDLENIYQLLIK